VGWASSPPDLYKLYKLNTQQLMNQGIILNYSLLFCEDDVRVIYVLRKMLTKLIANFSYLVNYQQCQYQLYLVTKPKQVRYFLIQLKYL